jgi:Domain of unknown function (DUF4232)
VDGREVIAMESASRRKMVRLVTVSAVVLVVGALALPALGAAGAASGCSGAQLRLQFLGQQAATGHRFNQYAFKNVGSATCSLRGYPGAVLLNQRGRVIFGGRANVGHWTVVKVRTVTVAPGKRAFFTFTWAAGPFCPGHAFTFYMLRVSPPGAAKRFVWHLGKTSACNRSAKISAVGAKRQ